MRTFLSTLVHFMLLAILLTAPLHAREIEHSLNAASGGKLYLKTDVGRLDIRTHDSETVLLQVNIDGDNQDDFNVEYQESGADITISGKMRHRENGGWGNNLRVEFIVTVPQHYHLEMHTSGGSIEIDDLVGNVDAHTSGGSIDVGNINGEVQLKTSGGSITTEAIHGALDAHTSGGSIRVTMAQQINEDAELSTSGGSITAYLIPEMKIDLDASTSGGRVRTDFDVDGKIKKKSIRGQINGGGPRLELHTSGGSISIKSL